MPVDVCPAGEQPIVHGELVEMQWVCADEAVGGGSVFFLTPAGRVGAQRMLKHGWRHRQVQQAMLEAVAERELPDTWSTTIEGLGAPFSHDELADASTSLQASGLIDGWGSSSGLIRPHLTDLGRECLASGYAPPSFVSRLRSSFGGSPWMPVRTPTSSTATSVPFSRATTTSQT